MGDRDWRRKKPAIESQLRRARIRRVPSDEPGLAQNPAYTPDRGRSQAQACADVAGARRPAQARVDLMLALGAGYDAAALRALFDG